MHVPEERSYGLSPELRHTFLGFVVLEVPFPKLLEFKQKVAKKLLAAGALGCYALRAFLVRSFATMEQASFYFKLMWPVWVFRPAYPNVCVCPSRGKGRQPNSQVRVLQGVCQV